jgi:hypothetical protein
MAHFAKIDENNMVVRLVVTDNNDPNGDEGYQWLLDNLGGTWIKTSYNARGGVHLFGGTPLRKNYAGIGYTYDSVRDAFIPPKPEIGEWTLHEASCTWITSKPFPSWIFNEEKISWEAPTPMPTDGGIYKWVEDDLNWQLVEGV